MVLGEQTHRSGVHWMRAEVGFVAPESVAVWQQDLPTDASLVPFAAAVQRAVAGRAQHRFSSDEATLHAFARQDASVRLADEGGQWVQAFNRPTLIVEVVDPDAEQVGRVLRAKVAEIRRTTAELQAAEGIAASRRIQVTMEAPDREQAAPSRGQLLRAGVVWLGVAGVASLCAAAAAGRLRRRDPEAGAAP
ncbi:hypothetical protein [Ornithinimicrobium pekingense]|uniref:hypothetical protein n=1 Tax=Ornithinimicrobium pekingense TaxID=384677 RepID=UPI0012EB9312|nr:hypothetical protein [Ornithinimicrobium pekingense]